MCSAMINLDNDNDTYKLIFHNASIGITLISIADGRFKNVNDEFCKITGFSKKQLLHKSLKDITYSKDIAFESDLIKNFIKKNSKNLNYEKRIVKKDDSIIWVKVFISFLNNKRKQLIVYYGEITNQKENELFFKEAREMANFGHWTYDIESKTLKWSDEVYRIFGLDSHDFDGTLENFLEYVHPDDQQMLLNAYKYSLENKESYDLIHRIIRPDNEIIYVHEHCANFYNKKGEAIRSLGTIQDITEQMNTELALFDSQQRLKLALEASQIGIWDWDITNNKLTCEERINTIFGLDKNMAITSDNIISFIHPDDIDRVKHEIEKIITNNVKYDIDYRIIRRNDESIRNLLVRGNVKRNHYGKAIKMIGICIDITDRKQVEEKLRITKYSIDNSQNAVFWVKPDGSFSYFNKAASLLSGYSNDELSQKHIYHLDEQMTKNEWPHFYMRIKTIKKFHFESQLVRKNKKAIDVELLLSYLKYEGSEYLLVFANDISKRKAIENEIRELNETLEQKVKKRTEELEKFNKAMIGREMRIIELKKEVNEAHRLMGKPEIYKEV